VGAAKAQELAETECAKYSRLALMTGKGNLDEKNYVFEMRRPLIAIASQ
jgi:hypothetical protein